MNNVLLHICTIFLVVKCATVQLIPEEGTPPSPRIYSSLAYSELYNSLIVVGGGDQSTYLYDIWVYDISENYWTNVEILPSLTPGKIYIDPRTSPIIFMSKRHPYIMYLLFGNKSQWSFKELWAYNFLSRYWKVIGNFDDVPYNYNIFLGFMPGSDENILIAGAGNYVEIIYS